MLVIKTAEESYKLILENNLKQGKLIAKLKKDIELNGNGVIFQNFLSKKNLHYILHRKRIKEKSKRILFISSKI